MDSVNSGSVESGRIYAASRASVPERPAMWQKLRSEGVNIVSSWIDEAEPGATADLGELWARIVAEIASADALVLYAETADFPLKGAFIEVGIALGVGKPVKVVIPGVEAKAPSYRPIGSWIKHPLVTVCADVYVACASVAKSVESGRMGARELFEKFRQAEFDEGRGISSGSNGTTFSDGQIERFVAFLKEGQQPSSVSAQHELIPIATGFRCKCGTTTTMLAWPNGLKWYAEHLESKLLAAESDNSALRYNLDSANQRVESLQGELEKSRDLVKTLTLAKNLAGERATELEQEIAELQKALKGLQQELQCFGCGISLSGRVGDKCPECYEPMVAKDERVRAVLTSSISTTKKD